MKRIGLGVVMGLLLSVAVHAAQVGLVKINGAIGPATASYLSRAIGVAFRQHDQCLIVQLDTPGGLLESTKNIVQDFYASKVPIVVYVAPSGACAGSAGVFITLAADVAAMAPHSSLGAAHPVQIGATGGAEKMNSVMKEKLENYASAFIETIAEKRHRNVEWARSAVLESKATTAEKALASNVVDLIADNIPDLLIQLNGRHVNGNILHTAGATVVPIRENASEKLFQVIWRPEVMFLLMLVAMYGIIGELSNPGAILPGVVGALALILLLYMSSILPVNVTGVVLICLAVVLFIIDVFTPTHGVLTFGGIVSFFLGAMMLFNQAGPGFQLSLRWIIPATLLTAAFFVFVVAKGIRAQFRPPLTGRESMIGKVVAAQSRIDAVSGKVFMEGEIWNAVSDTPVEAGQLVEVTGMTGLTLQVKPKN